MRASPIPRRSDHAGEDRVAHPGEQPVGDDRDPLRGVDPDPPRRTHRRLRRQRERAAREEACQPDDERPVPASGSHSAVTENAARATQEAPIKIAPANSAPRICDAVVSLPPDRRTRRSGDDGSSCANRTRHPNASCSTTAKSPVRSPRHLLTVAIPAARPATWRARDGTARRARPVMPQDGVAHRRRPRCRDVR